MVVLHRSVRRFLLTQGFAGDDDDDDDDVGPVGHR